MRRHRTPGQDAVITAFMQKNPNIAKGCRGNRTEIETMWGTLQSELNKIGPPTKSIVEWRRTFKDWKSSIRAKIVKNKQSNDDGRNTYKLDVLTENEKAIAIVADLYRGIGNIAASSPTQDFPFTPSPSKDDDTSQLGAYDNPPKRVKLDSLSPNAIFSDDNLSLLSCPDLSNSIPKLGDEISNPGSHITNESSLSEAEEITDFKDVFKEMVSELRKLNDQAKSGTEAVVAVGTQLSDLMEKQLEERKKFNSIFERFINKMD